MSRPPVIALSLVMLLAATAGFSPSVVEARPPATQNAAPPRPADLTPEVIIRRFAERETEFHRRLKDYTFRRDVVVQLVGMGKQIAGEYRRVSRLSFDPNGKEVENVITAPISPIVPTPEDMKDFSTIQTFAVEPSKIGDYDFTYIGRERLDELDVHAFDVKPKALADPKLAKLAVKNKDRYFEGRIWVDAQDFQLVKARGRGVPQGKQRFPVFETYREQADGRYWFPSVTFADDELVYPNGSVQRLRIRIKFSDYEKRGSGAEVGGTKPGS